MREVYLDNAATMTKYPEAIEAEAKFYTEINANPLRGLYKKSVQAATGVEEARKAVLKLVGADDSYTVIFTRGATEALNLVMTGLKKNERRKYVERGPEGDNGATSVHDGYGVVNDKDKVVVDIESHHSNILAGNLNYGNFILSKDLLKDTEDAKLVALTGISNITGENFWERIMAVRKRAPKTILGVDGAQMVGHATFSLSEAGVDFMAFSGHKFGAPMGIGGLIVKKELAEKMRPLNFGGGAVMSVDEFGEPILAEIPERFEAGTINVGGIFGLKVAAEKALTALAQGKNLEIEKLVKKTAEKLRKMSEVEVLAANGAILTFNVNGVHPHDTAQILAEEEVAVRAGFLCAEPYLKFKGWGPVVRASFSIFNTEDDMERLIEAVSKVREKMGLI